MHIPDGYLSPATCAGLYAASAPFWYVALQRIKSRLNTRAVPLLAVFSAFSFVLMMFNLPLPGGTTGHAVGMGMASIVLGPSMSILAISMALFIQAVFFGDGGITAFGANCFNMAIAGSLVAYLVYRTISAGAEAASVRRIVAAGLAGYAGINVAALLAAIEFGIQPLWFHDASGTPLYAPYPLRVAIPAMMIGHLTFAGLAECIITAGVVRYIGRADPGMLLISATQSTLSPQEAGDQHTSPMSRKLWLSLAIALCLTPLGLVAVGKAWGEWSPDEFTDPSARQKIAVASGNQMPPAQVPDGLSRLTSVWKAPLAGYESSLIRNSALGYFTCAFVGVALVIGFATLLTWSSSRGGGSRRVNGGPGGDPKLKGKRIGFLDVSIRSLLRGASDALFAESMARADGFLQKLDPRCKVVSTAVAIGAAISIHRISVLLPVFCLGVILGAFSGISPALLAKRVWVPVLAFTGVLALPAIFVVSGEELWRLPFLRLSITVPGITSAGLMLIRAEIATTFSSLLILSTPWNKLLRALRFLHVPAIVVAILQMTHRYVFLLLETAHDLLESRRTRLVGRLQGREQRHLAAATVGVLLDKTLHLGGEVHSAMQARGFRNEVYLLENVSLQRRDWTLLTVFLATALVLIWLGQ